MTLTRDIVRWQAQYHLGLPFSTYEFETQYGNLGILSLHSINPPHNI